jgi:hypothetical protein
MITSSFIRFGKDTNAILNIAHIVSVEPVTTIITEENREFVNPMNDGVAVYAIKVTTLRGSIEYALKTEARRDATYKKITAILSPFVLDQVEVE